MAGYIYIYNYIYIRTYIYTVIIYTYLRTYYIYIHTHYTTLNDITLHCITYIHMSTTTYDIRLLVLWWMYIYIYTEIVRGAQQSLAACIPGFPREDDHSTAATCGEDETKPRLDLVPSFGKWSYDDLNSIVGWDTHHGLSLYLANWVKNPNPKLEDRSSADPTRPCCLDTWDTMNPVNALKPHRLRGHIMAISR